jgi:3-oxoacyl-[acyl-carrier protein] reductase
MAVDLSAPNEATTAIQNLVNQFGNFDIVLHNLGGALGIKEPLADVGQWQRVWNFNAGISITINNLLIPFMKQNGWGRVIHISSISGKIGEPRLSPFGGSLPYAAAKAYLNAYVRGLGRELAEHNIVVCALMPAAVLSEGKYWDKVSQQDPQLARSFLESHHSIRRFGKPEEVAAFATFMASQHASFACGALIPIDGGRV